MASRPGVFPSALLLAALLAAAGCGPAAPKRPSVLLIVIDTLRRDHVGCYGYSRDTTPQIDRLAAVSWRYTHAFSQAPWTTPSIGALLSSRYPSELGISAAPDRLPDRYVLLAEALKAQGYATAAVISHYFLGSKWNFNQGFDRFDESNVLGHAKVSSPGVTDTAISIVDEHRRRDPDQPLFLFVHYFDPHYDYIEHEGFRFSDPAYHGPVASGTVYTDLLAMLPKLTPADVAHLVDLYDSEIAFTDSHVGRLLDHLRELGTFDDTLIVLTADHGEEFRERGAIGHGQSLYNELIRVPLLVKYPGSGGGVVEGNVGLIDVYPTLLDYMGIAATEELSGRSFLGQGPGSPPSPRLLFSETDWGHYRGVVRDQLKLLYHQPTGSYLFFDMGADPGERDNLTSQLAQRGLTAEFYQLQEKLRTWMEVMEREKVDGGEVDITPEERRQLEALGYLR
jgi:arylsulfatase A-like enzyme